MKEVYIIFASSGSYDDYSVWVDKVFLNEQNAEEYKNCKNLQLNKLKEIIGEPYKNYSQCLYPDEKRYSYFLVHERNEFYIEKHKVI